MEQEDYLREFIKNHNLVQTFVTCTKCNSYAKKSPDGYWRCQRTTKINKRKVKCNFKASVKKHSVFAASNMSEKLVVRLLAWYIFKPIPRQAKVMKEMEITANTYSFWADFCRNICLLWAEENSEMLGGFGKTVEIDEAKFGKRKYNVGRIVKGAWVFGGYERDSKKCFLETVPIRDKVTLLTAIKKWIKPGTTIISDCWKAYDCLSSEGYVHLTVNHSLNFVDPETGAYTNNIERTWRDAKRYIPPFGRREEYFDGYLAEFLMHRCYPDFKDKFHNFMMTCSKIF